MKAEIHRKHRTFDDPNVLKSPKNSNRFSTFRRWPSGYRFASNAPLSEENKGRLGASVAARVGHKKRVYRGGESCIDATGRDYLPGRSRVTPYGSSSHYRPITAGLSHSRRPFRSQARSGIDAVSRGFFQGGEAERYGEPDARLPVAGISRGNGGPSRAAATSPGGSRRACAGTKGVLVVCTQRISD